MDLKEFIKESIVQIAQGIEEANKELEKSLSMVNPIHIVANSDSAQAYAKTRSPSHDNPGCICWSIRTPLPFQIGQLRKRYFL